MPSPPPKRLYAGIAASAAAVLVLEIGLTRIFSYTIWYHFAYLTISVALLGYGAAGSALAAWPRLGRAAWLPWWAVAGEAGVLACLLVVRALPLDPLQLGSDAGQLARLVAYYAAVTLPFLCGGFRSPRRSRCTRAPSAGSTSRTLGAGSSAPRWCR
jgi:hypothetical protein